MATIKHLPQPLWQNYEWQEQGACRTAGAATFFPPEEERGPKRQQHESQAKAYCAQCPVVTACLNHALSVRESHGIWGGMTRRERQALLAEQRAGQRLAG